MLDVLVFSRPPTLRLRYLQSGSLSAVAHATIVALALVATAPGGSLREALAFDTTLVYIAPDRAVEPEKVAQEEEQAARQVLLVDVPVRGFQTIAAIADIPNEIPPIDLTQRFDPRDYSGKGIEGGVADGRDMDVAPGTVVRYSPVFEVAVVEEKPAMLEAGAPEYPPLLRQAGVQGRAVLEFVVDTWGRVEPKTIAYFGSSRTPVSADVGHLFRSMSDTRFARCRTPRERWGAG
jgi:hypothetical protein